MPLTKKGEKIKKAMEKEYGAKKGKKVFYASQNSGKIKGTHKGKSHRGHKMSEKRRKAVVKEQMHHGGMKE